MLYAWVIFQSFDPVISSEVATNQVNDSIESNAFVEIYQKSKPFVFVAWFCFATFVSIQLFKKKETINEK